MRDGFLKVATATTHIKVADCDYNADQIINSIKKAYEKKVRLVVFPELCITGYTCNDLFLQDALENAALNALMKIVKASGGLDMVILVGLPMMKDSKLYNVGAVIFNGKLLGIVPKQHLPNYSEFYEARHFQKGNTEPEEVTIGGQKVLFGANLLFVNEQIRDFILGVEICEDLWVPQPPSGGLSMAGATVIANLSAGDENTGKDAYRKDLVKSQSGRLICGYLYASAGDGESTTDLVFSGHNLIAENGSILAESERFVNQMIITELDLSKLVSERRRMSTFIVNSANYVRVPFRFENANEEVTLTRHVAKAPFVPSNEKQREKRCNEITMIQAMGLKKRLEHIGCKNVVIGISGGLDSTLALLVVAKAFDLLELDRKGIIAVTMPCFGTTDRTYNNAITLTKELNATIREVPISESVLLHMRDIGHDVNVQDVTYENSQARERTQVLMDLANECNGIVIGTGDMSELALGWATYNGDHMSMYGVNASVPKTLVRYLVSHFAQEAKSKALQNVLLDILDTPVSPELLPPKEGEIAQKTEDIVGPYELHDFFLYYVMRYGYMPSKIYRLAVYAFESDYSKETILKWEKIFYRRFFTQQFKRSCLPDGPKVGSVAVSPRGDLRMPSDASYRIWMEDLESINLENER
ncbi:MAG: NAD(+) synthase [Clostridiales bacterium]|nr:NAD(+) synthase [Clostridiales bacterium]